MPLMRMLWAIMIPRSTVRLPREIEADPRGEAIRAWLDAASRFPFRETTTPPVPVLPLAPALATALRQARGCGRLVLGLEGAAEALATEHRGLAALAKRTSSAQGARVSRLLLVSEDAAARLYREVARLADEHAPRVLVLMIACDAVALGRATLGRDAAVKVVLARHKEAVAAVLRALSP
jgi:hypothetical protein